MFHDWDGFFLLIGGAAGALIGLLFVVETLTSGFDRDSHLRGAAVFISPTVFHFAVVLVISAIALAPRLSAPIDGLLTGVCALVGLVNATVAAVRLRTDRSLNVPHWTDFWFYGFAPACLYLALVAAALSAWSIPEAAPYLIAAILIGLLVLGVRNAWDLVTWIAPAANRTDTSAQPPPRPGA